MRFHAQRNLYASGKKRIKRVIPVARHCGLTTATDFPRVAEKPPTRVVSASVSVALFSFRISSALRLSPLYFGLLPLFARFLRFFPRRKGKLVDNNGAW